MTSSQPPVGQVKGKKAEIEGMFDAIADRYDFLNRLLSLGVDQWWRRQAVRLLSDDEPDAILDVATGTGDLAIAALELEPSRVIGVDISENMLAEGRRKLKQKGLLDRIELMLADGESLPFADDQFDAALVAFGVRNFENLQRGLQEIHRVLAPDGSLVVLEFSQPRIPVIRQVYRFYFHYILPRIGGWISKDHGAYRYLPASVEEFPDGEAFLAEMHQAGYERTAWKPLLLGIASLYKGYTSREDVGDRTRVG